MKDQTGKSGKQKAARTSCQNHRVWEGSNARSCYYKDFFHLSFNSLHWMNDQTGKSGKWKAARMSRQNY